VQFFSEIEAHFGTMVREIVAALSDSVTAKDERKADWRTRKQAYLAALPQHSAETRLVSLADKLHNARSIIRDLKREGVKAFDRFEGKQAGTLWYYSQLREIFRDTTPRYLSDEFCEAVDEMMARATVDEVRHA